MIDNSKFKGTVSQGGTMAEKFPTHKDASSGGSEGSKLTSGMNHGVVTLGDSEAKSRHKIHPGVNADNEEFSKAPYEQG